MKTIIQTLFVILLFMGFFSMIAIAHEDYEALPNVSGAVTFFRLDKIAEAPFLPALKSTPLYKEIDRIQNTLEKKKMPIKAESLAVFPDGFLLKSNATPATVRYILKYKVLSDKLTWEEHVMEEMNPTIITKEKSDKEVKHEQEKEKIVKKTYFTIKNAEGETFVITFPLEHYILVRTLIPHNAIEPLSAKPLLKDTPDDVVLALLWPDPGVSAQYPLMGELKSVSVYIRYLKGEPRPVFAEVNMPAKSEESAIKITCACKEFFDEIYKKASKVGEIPKDMVNAFVVSSSGTTTKIHSSLTDDNAKLFLTLFLTALSDAIAPFEPPEFVTAHDK